MAYNFETAVAQGFSIFAALKRIGCSQFKNGSATVQWPYLNFTHVRNSCTYFSLHTERETGRQ